MKIKTNGRRKMKYECENCGNKKANDIRFNLLDLDHLDIIYSIVNNSDLTLEQIGSIVFSLCYVEQEESK